MVQIRKKTGLVQEFNANKIITSIIKSAERVHIDIPPIKTNKVIDLVLEKIRDCEVVDVRELHSLIITALEEVDLSVAQSYCDYSTLSSDQKFSLSEESTEEQFVKNKIAFINKYKQSSNTANSTIDDNSNVSNKNVAILNAEIHKPENIRISRSMVMGKLKELYPDFNAKRYIRDLEDHVIYKHDESSFAGICPYCVSITMYPFLLNGIKGLGGLSASPKNLKSFCGIFCNMIFAISSQFAGACLYKDQRLLINKDGLTYNTKIKDFVDKFSLKNQFSNYQGDWEYLDISGQDYFVEEDERKVKINKVFRRKYNEDIYKINTHSGLECCVSKDHKFKVLYRGRIIEVPANELQNYETLFVGTDHSCMINKNSQDYKDGQFLGIICGDGSVTNKNYVRIAINREQMYIKEFLENYFQDVYGKTGTYRDDNRRNAMCGDYTVSSVSIRQKICDLLVPCERHDTFTKNVDIKNKSIDFQLGFLDGLLVTDGHYEIDKGMGFASTNEGLVDTIVKILRNINISQGYKSGGKLYKNQTNKKPVYTIWVPSKVRKYLQLTLLKPCKSSLKRVAERSDTKEKQRGRELYYLGPHHAYTASGNKFRNSGNTHNKEFKSYHTDVLSSIEIFKNDDEYVYEIETETHWYNCGGLITHNCATSEVLLYFTYYCKKEWGPDFYLHSDKVVETNYEGKQRTILDEIHQYWQQIIYTINQPAAARGFQSAFVNFSYFDKPFFDGMFGDFCFPDGTQPDWESLKWIQMEFMKWFNAERLKTVLTFPVETVTLLYKDGKFIDEEMAQFVYDEYSRGHSFFTYISDTVDSLSSCCFSKNQKVLWKSSIKGVQLTTFEKLHNIKWEPYKKNLKIFHNGSWVSGKSIKLNNRKMFKVITYNNKELIVTDNHINVTLDGDKPTNELTTNDYLMFNNIPLQAIPENDEHLTYEQGFVIGAFLGDGSFGSEINNTIYDINFSLSINKYKKTMEMIDVANRQIGGCNPCSLSTIYNNVYPVRISSKELVAFIQRWTLWERGTYAYNKKLNLDCLLQSFSFRKGILDGWYHTDGGNSNRCYTTSKELAEDMEVLLTSLGLQSMINISDRTDEEVVIRDNHFKHNYPLYCVRWYSQTNIRSNKDDSKSWIKRNNSIYFRIKSIEEVDYTEDVYCIQCKNQEEPYFTLPNGIITHNCRLKNKLQTKEFNFTSGNIGIQTGSKSVITFNLNRLVQLWYRKEMEKREDSFTFDSSCYPSLKKYLVKLMDRVYKYHHAYNELLWDMYDADLLPAYKAGFIHLNKQYLTLGINGLNQAAEFLGMECSVNDDYAKFCQEIFSLFKEQNELHKDTTSKHHLIFNTEQVPAESLGAKNYNWDKEDGYWVGEDSNLYASYIFKPNNPSLSVLDKIKMHGRDYIGEYLDGGSACHINLDSHLSSEQYKLLLNYAAENGCNYLTFNIPMTECKECGNIVNAPVDKCPKCGCDKMQYYTRIIGYLTAVKNWNSNRQKEFETRMFGDKGNYKTYKAK